MSGTWKTHSMSQTVSALWGGDLGGPLGKTVLYTVRPSGPWQIERRDPPLLLAGNLNMICLREGSEESCLKTEKRSIF